MRSIRLVHYLNLFLALLLWTTSGCEATKPRKEKPTALEPITAAGKMATVPATGAIPEGEMRHIVGVMPKAMSLEYYQQAKRGAEWAVQELAVDMVFDGPADLDSAAQLQMLETWIEKGYDAIAVAPSDPDLIAPVLSKARQAGIKVLTWDADAPADSRDVFVNQCSYAELARTLVDTMVQGIGPAGKYVFLTGPRTASNQTAWMDAITRYVTASYPEMKNLSIEPVVAPEQFSEAVKTASACIESHPELQGVFALTSVAMPAAAQALRESNAAKRIFLTGLATPKAMRPYILEGVCPKTVMWNVPDLGYLTVYVAEALLHGKLDRNSTSIEAGHLGTLEIKDSEITMGAPMVFDKDNLDQYDF